MVHVLDLVLVPTVLYTMKYDETWLYMVFAIVVDKKGRSTEGSRIAQKPSDYFSRASA
eukprot:COSAG02_NODE_43667_length_372_cov_13.783883_1_plen_57_part_10